MTDRNNEEKERRAGDLQSSVDQMRREMSDLFRLIGTGQNNQRIEYIEVKLDQVATIVMGNTTIGVKSINERLGGIEAKVEGLEALAVLPGSINKLAGQVEKIGQCVAKIENQRAKERNILWGIGIGLGLNAGGLGVLLIKIFGA